MLELSNTHPIRPLLQSVMQGAQQAPELTNQMLAYSGQGLFMMEPLDVSLLSEDVTRLLEMSVSKNCVLKLKLTSGLPPVEADAAQLRQILMNLAINASEAIEECSGVVPVTTGAMTCDRECLDSMLTDLALEEGAYVYMEVADTGSGMSDDVISATSGTEASLITGGGTVLILDDEESVLTIGRRMLERMGFQVMQAQDGNEAMAIFASLESEIRLALLDLTTPHMDGEETFRRMRQLNSSVRVVLSSGYNEQSVTSRFAGKGLAGFIQKPYLFEQLQDAMAEALGINDARIVDNKD